MSLSPKFIVLDVSWASFSTPPHCYSALACSLSLLRSRMRDGSVGPCSSSFTVSSRATRTSRHESLPSTYVLANASHPKRKIFGEHCDLRSACSDLCGHWQEGIWSAFDASRKFHVLLRDIQRWVSFTMTLLYYSYNFLMNSVSFLSHCTRIH